MSEPGDIHEITLSGRGKNCLGSAMMQFVLDQLAVAGGRPVLVSGAGDALSAGLDLKEVASLDGAGMETFLRLLERMTVALYSYPAPTVALVNGHAIAGGCVVALCCDHRVAVNNPAVKIGLNEIALGLRFPPGVMKVVRARVPQHRLEEVILGAGLHAPDAALRLGLVDQVSDNARAVAVEHLKVLASHPAAAYAAAKDELRGFAALTADDERRFVRFVLPIWASPELKMRLAKVLAR